MLKRDTLLEIGRVGMSHRQCTAEHLLIKRAACGVRECSLKRGVHVALVVGGVMVTSSKDEGGLQGLRT